MDVVGDHGMRLLKRIIGWTGGVLTLGVVASFLAAYFTSGNTCNRQTGPRGRLMKAVFYCDYGSPDVIKFGDMEKPVPGDDQVLVKVQAASVNPVDWHFMEGVPYVVRVFAGLRQPNDIRMGVDYAGTVEAVGKNVRHFKPGDEVFGGRDGALAEYITVLENRGIVLKPASLTFEQAASVPVAAITALQGLRDQGKIHSGQNVLINGASGGVGTFAVQIAKTFNANVTGVTSTRNVDLVRSLGADRVIDYLQEDYTKGPQRYDLIFDCVGNRMLSENRRALTADGTYISIGGGSPNDRGWIGPLALPIEEFLLSPFVKQKLGTFESDITQEDLALLQDLLQSGKITPVIDRRYKLSETAGAIRYLEGGHARGKVVVTVTGHD